MWVGAGATENIVHSGQGATSWKLFFGPVTYPLVSASFPTNGTVLVF